MWDQVQDGINPQSANPVGAPTEQGAPSNPEVKTDVGPDYKSFFQDQMDARSRELEANTAKINDEKVSREEKLNLRERNLAIQEEQQKFGFRQSPAQPVDLSMVPAEKQDYLRNVLAKAGDDAPAIMEFVSQMYGAPSAPPPGNPANLDSSKGGNPPGTKDIRLNSANLLWVGTDKETVDATRKWFWEFLGTLPV